MVVGVIVEVAGVSMEPSLRRTWRVRIVPAEQVLAGDVILFQGRTQMVLHRVVEAFDDHLVHRGDGGGRMGLLKRDQILGRAVEVVSPPGPFPDLEGLPSPLRRAFARARRRARAYGRVRRLAVRLGLHRTPLRGLARFFWPWA